MQAARPKTEKKPRRRPIKASSFTKKHWENMGYRVAFVERYIHPIRKRVDAFGFADHIAFKPNVDPQYISPISCEIVALQSCAVDRLADHRKKIRDNEIAQEWMKAGHRIVIMAWERGKKRGMPNRLVMEEVTASSK